MTDFDLRFSASGSAWPLSIQGPDAAALDWQPQGHPGPTGPQGPTGKTGPQGPAGEDSGIVSLWENPNPTAAYAAQKLSLDLSEYPLVMVTAKFKNGTNRDADTYVSAIAAKNIHGMVQFTWGDTTTLTNTGRVFKADDSGIQFYNTQRGGTEDSSMNSYAVPTRVYGIRGVH